MHYNYTSLQFAFELLDREWENLFQSSGTNYLKINTVWRQLIGFEMRRLPGIDRCALAQGLYYLELINLEQKKERSYTIKRDAESVHAAIEFPIKGVDDSLDGLSGPLIMLRMCQAPQLYRGPGFFAAKLMIDKNLKLKELMRPPVQQPRWYDVLRWRN